MGFGFLERFESLPAWFFRENIVRPLLAFFVLTYAVSWTCFVAAGALPSGTRSDGSAAAIFSGLLILIGTFAPSLVALWLTARADGSAGVSALFGRMFDRQVGARWYVFAASYMAAIKLGAALVHRGFTGDWPRFGPYAWYLMLVATLFSTPVQAGEEIGWRGYALPRLASRTGFGPASLLLGVIWACWHLPLFFITGIDKQGQSFPLYLLQVTALSVAMAWLYAHTRGSLLPVMLMHAAVNNTKDIVPSAVEGATDPLALSSSLVAWLTVALLWVGAGYFLLRMPRADPPLARSR